MKKIKKILILLFVAAFVWSIIPGLLLYLKKEPPSVANREVIDDLKKNEGELFGFIIVGDSSSGIFITDSAFLKIIKHINLEGRWKKLPIDFVANVGDVTFRGSPWDYKVYNKLSNEIKWPVINIVGNHDDDHEQGAAEFKRRFGEKEFSFVNRNSYFIAVNNINGDYSKEQFQWFEKELKKSQAYVNRFILVHKQPVSSSYRHKYRPEVNPWSYQFMKLCEKYNVDIVFAGHEHYYNEQSFGGVTYITSGGGGMPLDVPRWEGGYLQYVVVRVNGDYVDYRVREVFPPFWRFFVVTMWQDIFYFIRDAFFR
ncbi:metallophosphoesterase family protein [Candidatus Omnitrophota bacterium]